MLSAAFSGEGENHLLLATDVSEEPFLHLPDALNLPEDFSCHVLGPILQSIYKLVINDSSQLTDAKIIFVPIIQNFPCQHVMKKV